MSKPKTPRQKLVDAVLKEVNLIRKHLGGPPLKVLVSGEKDNAESCPIANSINFGDITDWVSVSEKEVEISLYDPIDVEVDVPRTVEIFDGAYTVATQGDSIINLDMLEFPPSPAFSKFVKLFDDGKFPEYDEETEEDEEEEDYTF